MSTGSLIAGRATDQQAGAAHLAPAADGLADALAAALPPGSQLLALGRAEEGTVELAATGGVAPALRAHAAAVLDGDPASATAGLVDRWDEAGARCVLAVHLSEPMAAHALAA
ncbi:MAG TPA: hypothetical protein VLM17_02365 [Xanthomonadaceae bacterium]|nr:hypothetical protein [Xanthomonadaceae bacterium]